MAYVSISDLTLLEVMCGASRHFGCDQEWYKSWWKRTAGCGPSTFANIIYYISRCSDEMPGPLGREDFVGLMEDVWESVTPTMQGLSSTALFVSGARDYISRRGLDLAVSELAVERSVDDRPSLREAMDFISDVLSRDAPVAFLALDNGKEKRLDSWHWVTLLSIEQGGDVPLSARVLDNGKLMTVDLGCWLTTTGRGGGFVGICRDWE